MNSKAKNPPTVELVKSSYQPTEAEKEETVNLDIPGDSVLERMEHLSKVMMRPVSIRWISKPGGRC